MLSKVIEVGYGSVKKVSIGGGGKLVLIGGPCAIEDRDHAFMMAEKIGLICDDLGVDWIYKSCYDKDCRSSPDSYHGLGIEGGLKVLSDIRDTFGIPVTSDFSDTAWAQATGEVCDLVQVPAYLCRQTSILSAAARTGRPIHLKKGQFMSPWNMANSVKKIEAAGGSEVILGDRGTFFGYNMLVNDFRCLPIMGKLVIRFVTMQPTPFKCQLPWETFLVVKGNLFPIWYVRQPPVALTPFSQRFTMTQKMRSLIRILF